MDSDFFYSHGKLLLTGEYAVLDGAKALAFPCRFGQTLKVEKTSGKSFEWVSYLKNGSVWNAVKFYKQDILKLNLEDSFKSRILNVLHHIYIQNPDLFDASLKFSTALEFEKDWGLGSSSTLINNLSKWANINPYTLLENTFGGSGYDIAATQYESALIFQKQKDIYRSNAVVFPKFLKKYMYFVYLNQKQNSRDAIKYYREIHASDKDKKIDRISSLTEEIVHVESLEHFETLITTHENLISSLIGQSPIQEVLFKDYDKGIVKSLGAWGGDFALVTAKEKHQLDYFKHKGYSTIFNFSELILA